MKTQIFTLIIGLLFTSVYAMGQNKQTAPTVTKGYYAIGNNAAKLKPSAAVMETVEAAAATAPVVGKGYYAIGNNNSRLKKQITGISAGKDKPVISKGYYSIGNNSEKLRQ